MDDLKDEDKIVLKKIHLAVGFDKAYLHAFYALACSILTNNAPREVKFHLIADKISEGEREDIKRYIKLTGSAVTFYAIDSNLISQFKLINRWSSAVYYRLFFPTLVSPSIDRLLYLDTDTIVVNKLTGLYGTDLEGHPVGAVYDNYVKVQPLIGINAEGEYFNSGVLLIDLALWRSQRVTERTIEFLMQYPDRIQYVDQCALNAVLERNWKKLEDKYNLIYSLVPQGISRTDVRKFVSDKVIVHFTLHRPWSILCKNRLSYLYHYYLKRSPMGKHVAKYSDLSMRNVLLFLKIKVLHFYFDTPLLPIFWRKLKPIFLKPAKQVEVNI